jgi:hypothetical protein
LVEIRGNLLLTFMKELHGYAVMTRSFAPREGSDGFGHLFHGKAADQTLVYVDKNPAGDALPAQLLGRSWLGTEYTIRGEVVVSPKSGPW